MSVISLDEMSVDRNVLYGLNYKYSTFCKYTSDTRELLWYKTILTKDKRTLEFNAFCAVYRHILVAKNVAYIIEYRGREIYAIDLDSGKQTYISLEIKNQTLSLVACMDEWLIVYAVETGQIIIVNRKDGGLEYYEAPSEYVGKFNSGAIKVYNGTLCIGGYIANKIVEFDIKKRAWSEEKIIGVRDDICICGKCNLYYILVTKKEIVLWSKQKKCVVKEIAFPSEYLRMEKMPFNNFEVYNEVLFLFPFCANDIIAVNLKTEEIKKIYSVVHDGTRKKISDYVCGDSNINMLYGIDCTQRNVLLIMDETRIEDVSFQIDDSTLEEIEQNVYLNRNTYTEDLYSLYDIIGHLHSKTECVKQTAIGERIHESIIGQ